MLFAQRNRPVRREKAAAKADLVDPLARRDLQETQDVAPLEDFDPIDAIVRVREASTRTRARSARIFIVMSVKSRNSISPRALSGETFFVSNCAKINRGGLAREGDAR